MNPLLEELFPKLDPDFEPETFDSEDLENDNKEPDDDELSSIELENLNQPYDSLAGALVSHYVRIGAIPDGRRDQVPEKAYRLVG